jgi:biopolymer transport protein ExbD
VSLSAGGGEGEGRLFTEINVTPLTDIFLVLLIIFMVTASGLTASSLDVALPKAGAPGEIDAHAVIVVSIDARKRVFVENTEVRGPEIERRLEQALSRAKDRSVVLAGDRSVPLEKIVAIMDAARRAGARRFAIAVSHEKRRAAEVSSAGAAAGASLP